MIKAYQKLVLGCATVGAILILVSFGCGGGGGGGGGSVGPTAPTIADVAGSWTGSFTLEGATGCGCVGSITQLLVGLTVASNTEISQSGSALQGTLTSPWSAELCEFTGTVGSESIGAEATGCVIEEYPGMECPDGQRRDLHWSGATLQATVFGNDLNGTLVESWACFHSGNGQPKGTLTLQGRIEQKRG